LTGLVENIAFLHLPGCRFRCRFFLIFPYLPLLPNKKRHCMVYNQDVWSNLILRREKTK